MKRLCLVLLSVTGCSQQDPVTFTPIQRAVDTTYVDVSFDAIRWAQASPSRGWAVVSPTGSMKPFFDEHSILLFIKYSGQPTPNGTIVIFDRSDTPNVVHVIADQTPTHVYMSGYANRRSDGWFPKSTIKGIVTGQLYLP